MVRGGGGEISHRMYKLRCSPTLILQRILWLTPRERGASSLDRPGRRLLWRGFPVGERIFALDVEIEPHLVANHGKFRPYLRPPPPRF